MELNLGDLFYALHGERTAAFEPVVDTLPVRKTLGDKAGAPLYAYDVTTKREYYMPVTLSWTETGNDALQYMDLPHPVISAQSSKKIIDTDLTERRGSVSELINLGNVDFTIRGVIISATNELPEAIMDQLWRLYVQQQPLKMVNALSDLLLIDAETQGSDLVVIRSIEFPEAKGVKGVRGYVLTLKSDAPFSLTAVRKTV